MFVLQFTKMSVLLTMSSMALSSLCCAENVEWIHSKPNSDGLSLASTSLVSKRHSGVFKLNLTQSTDGNSRYCEISPSFSRENTPKATLEIFPRSVISRCRLGSNLGSEIYGCHIQTIASRSLQTITLDVVPDKAAFLSDMVLFSRYAIVSVDKTPLTEAFDLQYNLSGLSPLVNDWCRDPIRAK